MCTPTFSGSVPLVPGKVRRRPESNADAESIVRGLSVERTYSASKSKEEKDGAKEEEGEDAVCSLGRCNNSPTNVSFCACPLEAVAVAVGGGANSRRGPA